MQKMRTAIFAMISIFSLCGCANAGGGGASITGMLIVVDNCLIPEGCGPRYRLMDENFQNMIPLIGDIRAADSGLIVTARGQWGDLPQGAENDLNYRGPWRAFFADDYQKHSDIKYHSFLVAAAREESQKKYGCAILWNKTFGWKFENSIARIRVRMTDTYAKKSPQPFIEFAFDANSGELLNAPEELNGRNPCADN